jgi:hypothetical protein
MAEERYVKVKLPDGQELEYPADIAGSDELLKEALAGYSADFANAEIKRSNGKIRVVKKAAGKGLPALDTLRKAPPALNPATVMVMASRSRSAHPDRARMDDSLIKGIEELSRVQRALLILREAQQVGLDTVPDGF